MKKLLIVLLGIFYITRLYAQDKTVRGKITTFIEIPVGNVLIKVKSSNQKFYSDSLGLFSLQCAPSDKLTVSAEGFSVAKIRVKKETKYALINLNLMRSAEAKDLAVGYGHIKDKDKLYALSSHDESNFNFSQYHSIYEILKANFVGVQVINGEVIIRNSTSFGGSASALLIVDGREVSTDFFANIEPRDIAQVNILKDTSASVYGVQGANGVVIVETKRGPQRK